MVFMWPLRAGGDGSVSGLSANRALVAIGGPYGPAVVGGPCWWAFKGLGRPYHRLWWAPKGRKSHNPGPWAFKALMRKEGGRPYELPWPLSRSRIHWGPLRAITQRLCCGGCVFKAAMVFRGVGGGGPWAHWGG